MKKNRYTYQRLRGGIAIFIFSLLFYSSAYATNTLSYTQELLFETSVGEDAVFHKNFPEIEVYAGLLFALSTEGENEVCFGGCTNVRNENLLDIDELLALFAFNRNPDGKLRGPGGFPGGLQFGETDTVLSGIGEVTLSLPHIKTTSGGPVGDSLPSEGSGDLISLGVELEIISAGLLGMPPLEGSFFASGSSFDYNILAGKLGPSFGLSRNFRFNPDLTISLDLGTGATVQIPFGGSVDLVMTSQDLNLTPTFSIPNSFQNQTNLDLRLGLEALSASISASAGVDVLFIGDLGISFEETFGPLFKENVGVALFDIAFLDGNVPLPGFNTITPSAFVIQAIPEPGTLLLLGLGLLGLGFLRKKRSASTRCT